jgi:threonine/homoserine/homoserine lactone efflux protein
VLRTSALAFTAVKYAGAAYLVYLGIRTIRRREEFEFHNEGGERTPADAFAGGLTVNVLNPQVALFFLAFLPQFVRTGASASLQMAFLGVLYSVLTIAYLGLLALLAQGVRRLIERRPTVADGVRWLAGTVLVGFGLQLLSSERAPV